MTAGIHWSICKRRTFNLQFNSEERYRNLQQENMVSVAACRWFLDGIIVIFKKQIKHKNCMLHFT